MSDQRFFQGDLSTPMVLDDKGRCCGRKPLVYKREGHRFCDRCNRAYHYYGNYQIENWAWKRQGEQFVYSSGPTRISQQAAVLNRKDGC